MTRGVDKIARSLANQLAEHERRLNDMNQPQLAYSSIENGSIDEYNVDGTLVSSTGKQFDGSHGSFSLTGPIPAQPTPATLTAGVNSLTAR